MGNRMKDAAFAWASKMNASLGLLLAKQFVEMPGIYVVRVVAKAQYSIGDTHGQLTMLQVVDGPSAGQQILAQDYNGHTFSSGVVYRIDLSGDKITQLGTFQKTGGGCQSCCRL